MVFWLIYHQFQTGCSGGNDSVIIFILVLISTIFVFKQDSGKPNKNYKTP